MENRYSDWDRESLIKEIEKLKKRFGIVFEKRTEDVVEMCKRNMPFLVEDKSRFIKASNSAPTNILIESDNYYALLVLSCTHKNKIDIIYIDPPYNTGNKDWKYNNNYIEKNDGYKHNKWLNFMENRLLLAKDLLTDNGTLICTIDYHEFLELGMLLKKVFPSKEIVCVTIVHNPRGIQGKNFSYIHEYAYFVYPGNSNTYIGEVPRPKPSLSNLRNWGSESSREHGKNCFYPFFIKDSKIVDIGDVPVENFHPKSQTIYRQDGLIEVWPIDKNKVEKKWRYAVGSVNEIFDNLRVESKKSGIEIMLYKDKDKYKTVWIDKRHDANVYGTNLVRSVFKSGFNYPKSIYAVEDCIKAVIHDKDNAIILDFFAGSGTTAHAVMNLNKQDGGNRQFIMCTNNEGNICHDDTYPRIKQVIQGCDTIVSEVEENNSDFEIDFNFGTEDKKSNNKVTEPTPGLVYFNIDFQEATEITDDAKVEFASKSIDIICLKENCFNKVSSEGVCEIYKNNEDKYLGIVFNDIDSSAAINFLVKEIKRIKKKFVVYMFSFDSYIDDEKFKDVMDLVDLRPFPVFVLDFYERIRR
jgi:adenine-specific DNA-methyltransferase